MDESRLTQLISFLEAADRLKSVYRATYLTTEDRHENDAEHICHMALFALLLAPETGLQLNMERVFELILVHDLVEIIAGDTPAYDLVARELAKEREARAADELFGTLPPDVRDRLHGAWHEFENGDTPEAHFTRALDRLQAFSQNVFNGGRNWHEHGVTEDMTRHRNAPVMALDPSLHRVCELLYRRAEERELWKRSYKP